MMNEKEIVKETSPEEIWEAVNDETRENVVNMFLHLAFKFVITEATRLQINKSSIEQGGSTDDAG